MRINRVRWAGISALLTLTGVLWGQEEIAGEWMLGVTEFGETSYTRLTLEVTGGKWSGTVAGRPVEVSVNGNQLSWKDENSEGKGTLSGSVISGELSRRGGQVNWRATRVPERPTKPSTHDFEPTQFELYFSSSPRPVLRVFPGDTVRTWGVDAGGVDAKAIRRSPGGNPQTGPFFIEGAVPGDTLVVHLNKVRMNRDWAVSGVRVMESAMQTAMVANLKWIGDFPKRWKLDREKGIAYLEKPTEKLRDFTIPLAPMLGCIAVAPEENNSVRSRDSGSFGGNMDYNQIREGATVYLPVYHPGALLYLGDGHAAQGDGELTGDALETSMDVEFTVDLIKGKRFGQPLAENEDYLMSIGIGGSLTQALQSATSGMIRWLTRDYKLSANESAIVMGFAVRYDVVDLVGTQVSIAAKLPKKELSKLKKQ